MVRRRTIDCSPPVGQILAASRVNGPPPAGNRGSVAIERTPSAPPSRWSRLAARIALGAAALGLGLLTGGCAGAGAGLSLAGLAPGTTAIRVANHVAAPDELDRVIIAIDGEAVPFSAVPPPGQDPAIVTALRLRPGAHTITVRAVARGPRGESTAIALAQQAFHVTGGAVAILVDVQSPGAAPGPGSGERVMVGLAIRGGALGPAFGAAPPEDKDERCAPLLPVPRAICRAAVDLDAASRRNDAAAVSCVQTKLGEMRRLALIAETSGGDAGAMVEREVVHLSAQADACIGSLLGGPDGTKVIKVPLAPTPVVPTAAR
jgi:hypothetical protein